MSLSTFRGASGDVVRGFVHPRTFLTLVPVALALAICALPVMALVVGMAVPTIVVAPLTLIVVGPVIGRFALAAREGRLTAGFVATRPERAALLGFVARYAAVTLTWSAVALSVAALASGWLGVDAVAALAEHERWLLAALLGLAATTAGLVAIAVATRAESIGEALGIGSWGWILGERRQDLVVLVTSFVGAGATFAAMAWPLGRLLEPIAATFVHDVGLEPIAGLSWALPLLGLLVLAGRLGGAFGAEHLEERESETDLRQRLLATGQLPASVLTVLTGTTTPSAPPTPVRTIEPSDGLRSPADRLGTVPDNDLGRAVIEAEQLLRMEPHKPNVAAELARLYQRAGCPEEAHRVAGIAIERALAAVMPTVAAQVFHRFDPDERAGFRLAPGALEQLGWLLLRRKEIEGALWCFETFGTAGGERRRLEKGLVALADAVALDGDHLRAIALYRNFLRQFAESPSAAYVRSTLARLDATARRSTATTAASPPA